VLVVEDEATLAKQLIAALHRAGYAVDHASDGKRADLMGRDERYDAVVLDLGLPEVDGLTLLRRWCEAGEATPVLVLTARGSWHEKVLGIDSGADDYMAKPFRMEELLARVRALIRRSSGQDGAEVKLTSHEFRVLSYLMHHSDRVVSQGELTEHIYSQSFDRDSNTVEVFIARLRRKLGPSFIDTVRGLGYRMKVDS
jgi:two-component system OmpR family response regulator